VQIEANYKQKHKLCFILTNPKRISGSNVLKREKLVNEAWYCLWWIINFSQRSNEDNRETSFWESSLKDKESTNGKRDWLHDDDVLWNGWRGAGEKFACRGILERRWDLIWDLGVRGVGGMDYEDWKIADEIKVSSLKQGLDEIWTIQLIFSGFNCQRLKSW
jgi:hypothetical protein